MESILLDILKLNNYLILEKIAENKYNNKEDISKFIEKYNKDNYLYFKVVKENNIDIYKKRINKLINNNV